MVVPINPADVPSKKWTEVNKNFEELAGGGGGGGGDITASQITDSTAIGRQVLTATDAAAARTAIGAGTGTSNLAIGTTATTAKAGNYAPPVASAATAGLVRLSTDSVQTVAPASATTTAARSYMVQNLESGQMVVNVPWVNTTYTLPNATTTVRGGVLQVTAPTIAISDPVDDENVQAAFDSLVAALRTAGVLV